MKNIILLFSCLLTLHLSAQRNIDLTYPASSIKTLDFFSEWGDVKIISSADANIHITGTVSLNFDENNDWFRIEERGADDIIRLKTIIENEDEIFNEIIARDGDETIRIRGGRSWRESEKILKDALGEDHNYKHYIHHPAIEIALVIHVPKSVMAKINTEHGDVEIKCNSALDVHAEHGHIAASFERSPDQDCKLHSEHDFVELVIPDNTKAKLQLKTAHGILYTNFETSKINIESFPSDRRQYLRGNLNNGDKVNIFLTSEHDDVYLKGS